MKNKKLKILVACEFSQVVCCAFRKRGHKAYSCDVVPQTGNHPEWHILDDVARFIVDKSHKWDMVIAFPPCTHLARSGGRWFKEKQKDGRQQEAIKFFKIFTRLKCKWAIENPIGIMSTHYRKPDQIVQPWMFGHGETKATCLWLHDLPLLQPTKIVDGRSNRIHMMPDSKGRSERRSITYTGLAEAMAAQWG